MIDDPNLNCEHCQSLKDRVNARRLCDTPSGCPIEDVATDIEINEFCHRFNFAKSLFAATSLPDSQIRIFKELGLFENESLWIELEVVHAEWIAKQKEKKKWNKII